MENWGDIHANFHKLRGLSLIGIGEEFQSLWEKHDFNYQTTKDWKEALGENFDVNDWAFCVWLRDEKHLTAQRVKQKGNAESLRKEYNNLWTDIASNFNLIELESYFLANFRSVCQQHWEVWGFTYQDAQKFIAIGFETWEYGQAKHWENHNFSFQQAKVWREAGLKPPLHNSFQDKHFNYAELAAYLRWKKGIQPKRGLNVEQLKEEFKTWLKNSKPAQEYLDIIFPQEQRSTLRELNLGSKNLTGSLDLSDLVNLEWLNCSRNKLIFLNLANCGRLKKLYCDYNHLTELKINHLRELTEFWCSDNQLPNLDLSNDQQLNRLRCSNNHLTSLQIPASTAECLTSLIIDNNNFLAQDLSMFSSLANLEYLIIGNDDQEKINQGLYNRFCGGLEPLQNLVNLTNLNVSLTKVSGSLKPLQNLTKLKYLDISNTDLDSGLEYLPKSIETFYCSAKERPEAKVKAIYNLFANAQGEVETDKYGRIKNLSQKLQDHVKQKIKKLESIGLSEAEINQWKYNEYNFVEYLKLKNYEPNPDLDLAKIKEEYQQELEKHRRFYEIGRASNDTLHQRWKQALNQQKLQDQLKILEKEEARLKELVQKISELIPFLEKQIEKSESLIREQKKELTKGYLSSFTETEEDDLQTLIKVHRSYMVARAQKESVDKYFDRYSDTRKRLKNKLGKEFIKKADSLLLEFEKLCYREWDLQEQLKEKDQNIATKTILGDKQNQIQQLIQETQKNIFLITAQTQELATWQAKFQQLQLDTAEKQSKLITEQVINKIEEITEDGDKIFSSTEKPILEEKIGEGGYGEVYRGKHESREVAIKKLTLSSNDDDRKQEIRDEINILKKLRDRNIIQYYGVYYKDKEVLIITDFAENGTLTKFINDNKDKDHDWNLNNKIIKQIASGLNYIHHKKIIHCDLKSLNVLLAAGNQAKVADFGLAKFKDISLPSGEVKGSLRWTAPEIIREQKYSEQSDIYALGMIVWEIAAKCTVPFRDFDNNSVMIKIALHNGKETIPSDIPQNIQEIIKGCWEDNPQKRISLESIVERTEQTAQIQQNYPFNPGK